MPKQFEYIYEVTGTGRFPIDMMRYDRCWPATEEDTYLITYATIKANREGVVVKLRSLKEPTHGRWMSFGWLLQYPIEKRQTA